MGLGVVALTASTLACGAEPTPAGELPARTPHAAGRATAVAVPRPAGASPSSGSGAEPIRGSPDAPVTITEFAEFYCPFCALYLWEIFPQIDRDYIETGLANYQFHNLVVHGPSALLASAAGECAHEQRAFWSFHDLMFEQVFPGRNLEASRTHELGELEAMAGPLALDPTAFSGCLRDVSSTMTRCQQQQEQCLATGTAEESCGQGRVACMTSHRVLQRIAEDRTALDRLVERLPDDERPLVERIGTPTFFINGHVLVGAAPYEEFKALIDRELERARRR